MHSKRVGLVGFAQKLSDRTDERGCLVKKLGLLAIVCMIALALCACSSSASGSAASTSGSAASASTSAASSKDYSDSKFVGTWKVDTITFKDTTEPFDTAWTLVVKADGTGQSISEDETEEFTWTPTDNGFKTKGDVKATFVADGDSITTKIIGATLRFNKAA